MQIAIISADRQQALSEALAAAWAERTTFACIPARAGVALPTIEQGLSQIPPQLAKDHFVMLTSGSTGEPKFVVGSRERALALAHCLHAAQDSEPVDEAIVALPLSYTYAFVNQFVWSQRTGRRLVVTEGFGEPELLEAALREAQQAMLCLVGAQVPLLLRYWGERSFPGVLRLHFAGGRFPQESIPALQRMFPSAAVYNNYGCAEAMPRLALRPAEAAAEGADIGKPLPGVELRALPDATLEFRSAYQAVAVVGNGAYQAIDDAQWTPTGDLGEPLASGHWRLLGRRSEVFKRFGEKVSLAALLDAVKTVWSGEAAMFLRQEPGEEPAHVLVLAPVPSPEALREVLLRFRALFTRAQWPVQVAAIATMPTLPSGKPDTAGLAARTDLQILWRQRN
ncbi:MAG: AMP-binding protein [Rubrivivax sp.]